MKSPQLSQRTYAETLATRVSVVKSGTRYALKVVPREFACNIIHDYEKGHKGKKGTQGT